MNKYDKVVIKIKNRLMRDIHTFTREDGFSKKLKYAKSLLDDVNQWILEAKVERWEAEIEYLNSRLIDAEYTSKKKKKEVTDKIKELESFIEQAKGGEQTHRPARKLYISK